MQIAMVFILFAAVLAEKTFADDRLCVHDYHEYQMHQVDVPYVMQKLPMILGRDGRFIAAAIKVDHDQDGLLTIDGATPTEPGCKENDPNIIQEVCFQTDVKGVTSLTLTTLKRVSRCMNASQKTKDPKPKRVIITSDTTVEIAGFTFDLVTPSKYHEIVDRLRGAH